MSASHESGPAPIVTQLGGSPVAGAYDRWSLQYDNDRNPTRDLDAAVLRRNAVLALTGRSVLEIGCGTGKNTAWLAQHASKVVALDFSAGMLAVAAERVQTSNVHFIQHDICERWPVADASFDAVVGNLTRTRGTTRAGVRRSVARATR